MNSRRVCPHLTSLALILVLLAACVAPLATPPPVTPSATPSPGTPAGETPTAATPTESPILPTPLVTEVDPEEYALFSAMLDQRLVGYQQEGAVVIRAQTSADIDVLEFALEGPSELPADLVEAYRLRNDQPYTLDRGFTLKDSYELMPQPEYEQLLRTAGTSWEDFEARYPQAEGVFLFSRAGLNATRDQALVTMSYYCGSLCLEGGMFLMEKQDGIWKVKQELVVWMA